MRIIAWLTVGFVLAQVAVQLAGVPLDVPLFDPQLVCEAAR